MVPLSDEWVLLVTIGDDIIVGGRLAEKAYTAGYHHDGNHYTTTTVCIITSHHQAKRACDGGLQPACSQLCSCSNMMLGTMDRQRRFLGSTCHGSHGPRGWNDPQPSLGYMRIPRQAWILP